MFNTAVDCAMAFGLRQGESLLHNFVVSEISSGHIFYLHAKGLSCKVLADSMLTQTIVIDTKDITDFSRHGIETMRRIVRGVFPLGCHFNVSFHRRGSTSDSGYLLSGPADAASLVLLIRAGLATSEMADVGRKMLLCYYYVIITTFPTCLSTCFIPVMFGAFMDKVKSDTEEVMAENYSMCNQQ